jgi:1-phosphatidylinositol-4-phosphate 5-kinase
MHMFTFQMLLKMLPAYYNHVRALENTLVTKFFGLHCVKLAGANQKKVRDECSCIILLRA